MTIAHTQFIITIYCDSRINEITTAAILQITTNISLAETKPECFPLFSVSDSSTFRKRLSILVSSLLPRQRLHNQIQNIIRHWVFSSSWV